MANTTNQKLRLLHLLKLFIKKTSTTSGLTTNQFLDELTNVNIDTERKTLYRDFKAMREFGLAIEQNKAHEWYLSNRPFSEDELVMLVDAVQSTPFLTENMSENLITKLKAFVSEKEEQHIDARIEMSEYVKMTNKDVFWNINVIQKAINSKKKVSFKYFRYEEGNGKPIRGSIREHLVIPLKLIYADEKYYLLTYNENFDDMTPYRVDRMFDVACTNDPIPRRKEIATWKLEDDIVLSFGVFGTKVESVTLDVHRDWLNVVVDKFGTNLDLYDIDRKTIRVHVKAPLSPQFFGWLFQLTTNAKLVAPKKAIEKYQGYCQELLHLYEPK